MKLFLNSCNLEEIREIAAWGILDGITMNPTMQVTLKPILLKTYVRSVELLAIFRCLLRLSRQPLPIS